MEEIKINNEFFDEILNKISNQLIKLNCNRLLLNDNGLDESKFQLLLVNQLLNKEIPNLKIEMEKYISPGNRCDVYLNLDRDHFIIELKYIRIPFLELTKKDDKDLYVNKKLKLYESTNNSILKMDKNEILSLNHFNKFIKPINIDQKPKEYYEPISKIMENGIEQVKKYANEFNDFKMKKQNIYYLLIIGIGYKFIRSEINKI